MIFHPFCIFYILSGIFIFLFYLIIKYKTYIPCFYLDLYLYGKVKGSPTSKTISKYMEMPKRWFTYFYISGMIINTWSFYVIYLSYTNKTEFPNYLNKILNFLKIENSYLSEMNPLSTVLLVFLMFFHNTRRAFESLFISVYSKSTMSILHFMYGIILYSSFHICILLESQDPTKYFTPFLNQINSTHLIGLSLFIWASYEHHVAHRIFANLRKNNEGIVTNEGHFIPQGGMFNYVSSPHYLMEILIYISFFIISGFHATILNSIVLFVIFNQLPLSMLTHDWYKKTYSKYPKNRKALFPFLL